jgi:CheY-like chemotaxis protein
VAQLIGRVGLWRGGDSPGGRRRSALGEPEAGVKVLYVEDDEMSMRLVETVLRRRGDCVLLSARDGEAGLRLAAGMRPDLVLLDLHLPDMSGERFLRCLQAPAHAGTAPVVVLSADARPETAARLLAAGAAHFLTKPLDLAQLQRRLDDATTSAGSDDREAS